MKQKKDGKCTCGVDITYGRDAKYSMHSDYCDKYGKGKTIKLCTCDAWAKYGIDCSKTLHDYDCPLSEIEWD